MMLVLSHHDDDGVLRRQEYPLHMYWQAVVAERQLAAKYHARRDGSKRTLPYLELTTTGG